MSHGVADLTVRSNAPLDMFKRVLVDGIELTSSSYELTEGSTTVTLRAGYLSTLATGTHMLAIESETGTASTTFTIVEKQAEAGGAPPARRAASPQGPRRRLVRQQARHPTDGQRHRVAGRHRQPRHGRHHPPRRIGRDQPPLVGKGTSPLQLEAPPVALPAGPHNIYMAMASQGLRRDARANHGRDISHQRHRAR